ncbi:hypothetical protein KUCAC02_028850 [Chaenocephalus aceratus]|uniref:Uncharacterized protein n=1 Tax=Chaenocephalus aceratus TaxID=36190 RepID=A0ACB9X4M9_CHAAC|nr:hypothetical protein KUCAC02_028850 [Chaenocephalus aceratus]
MDPVISSVYWLSSLPLTPSLLWALFLLDRWWTVDGLLQTADPERDGAMEVETVGERIVLYILNRVVYRAQEMSSEELPFLCHGEKDHAKILWRHGEAVGFYSVKRQGTLCSSYSTRSYQLTVMDSIFVRKSQRGNGFGLQMLEDFVLSSKEDCLGLRYPLTKPMYKVCEKYLCQYPEDTHLLWEVESIGAPNQRTNISSRIQAMDQIAVSKSLTFTEESLVITEMTEKDVVMEAISTQIKEAESMECTVEIVEEVTVLSATKVSEAEVPPTARGRSSGSKRRKMAEKIAEDKSEKIIRIEDIEAETPREEHVAESLQTEDVISVVPGEQGQEVVDTEATILGRPDGGDAPQDPNTCSHDSQIAVENVASGIEGDTAALPLCGDISLEPRKQKLCTAWNRQQQLNSKWSVYQHMQQQRTVKLKKQEEPLTTRKYTRRSQRVREEVDAVSAPEAVTGGEAQEEKTSVKEDVVAGEELAEDKLEGNEEETEKQQEELELTAETAATPGHEEEKVPDERETKQTGDEATQNKPDKRALRGRYKVATKQSRDVQKQEEEPLGEGEQRADAPTEEHQQVGEEADKTEGEISTEEKTVAAEETVPKAEEVAPSTEVTVEEVKEVKVEEVTVEEVQVEEESTEPEQEAVVTPEEDPREPGEPQEKDTSSEIPKLQKATVILVDIKTTSHHLSAKEADEAVGGETAAPEEQHGEEAGGKQEHSSEGSAETGEKQELEDNSEEAEEKQSAIVAEKEMVIETREEKPAEESEGQQQLDDTMGEDDTTGEDGTMGEDSGAQKVEEAETDPAEEEQREAKEAVTAPVESADICAEREEDVPDHAEESLPPAEEGDEPMSLGEEDTPVVVTRALRNRAKRSAATPRPASEREERLEPKEGVEKALQRRVLMEVMEKKQGWDQQRSHQQKRTRRKPRKLMLRILWSKKESLTLLLTRLHSQLLSKRATPSVEEQPSEEPDLQETLRNDAQEQTPATAQENAPEPEVVTWKRRKEKQTRRSSRKQAAEATPRTRAARSKQKKGDGEKEAASEIQEEEPAVEVRVLRRGRKKKEEQAGEDTETTEEAVPTPGTVEEEQPTSTSEGAESAQETVETAEGDEAKVATELWEAEGSLLQRDVPPREPAHSGRPRKKLPERQKPRKRKLCRRKLQTQKSAQTRRSRKRMERKNSQRWRRGEEEPEAEQETVGEEECASGEETAADRLNAGQQDDEEEVAGGGSAQEEEPVIETRVLRKGRKSAAAAPSRTSRRAQHQKEEEAPAPEDTQAEEEEGSSRACRRQQKDQEVEDSPRRSVTEEAKSGLQREGAARATPGRKPKRISRI